MNDWIEEVDFYVVLICLLFMEIILVNIDNNVFIYIVKSVRFFYF